MFGTDEHGTFGIWWIPIDGGDISQAVSFDGAQVGLPDLGAVDPLTVSSESFYITLSEVESDIWVMDLDW